VKRAEPPSRDRAKHAATRIEIDRRWIWRALAAILLVAFLLLVAKVSLIAFGGAARRLDRFDPGHGAASEVAPGGVTPPAAAR
jgi:hypothetical protein